MLDRKLYRKSDKWASRKKNKIITNVMLCMGLIFLAFMTGCGSSASDGNKENQPGSNSSGGMGRYVEEISPLPEEINRNGGLNMLADGSMTIISYNSGLYRSTDQGASWQQEEVDYFPMMQDVYSIAAVMSPEGTAAVTCSGKMPQAAREVFAEPLLEDWEGNYCIFAFPDREMKIVDFGFSQEDGSCISSLVFKEDGRLFAGDMNGKIYEVDMEHESLKELFMMEREAGYISFCGDILMAVSAEKVYLYDLEEQVPLTQDAVMDGFIKNVLADGTVRYTGGGYPLIVFGGDDSIVYIACVNGLYRHALGGSTVEQIIDGALSTFGDDGSIYKAMELEGQEFLVQFNTAGGLVRYHFDESMPSMPDQEIRIYSLKENGTVRQAVTSYKKEHTDMYVRYEVGMDGEDGMTEEDAIKRLNTRILSGEGPDVIILDGLPMDSYMEKEMLADLSETLESLGQEDALFSNLKEGFRQENGEIYAMPLCIQVPLLVGNTDFINNMRDLKGFADGMEELREEYPDGGLLGIYDAEAMLKLFGMVSSSAWVDETGQIDREAVEEFLMQVKRIYEAELFGALPEEMAALQEEDEELSQYGVDAAEYKMEVCNNVIDIRRGYARLACGYVDSIQLCLDNVTSVIRLEENMTYQNFSGQAQDVFIPKVMVGISGKSGQMEAAQDFVKTMFSFGVQERVRDGFPVNRAAFENEFDFYEPNGDNGNMSFLKNDETEDELRLYWPDEAEEQAFTELVQGLKVPATGNEWLSELVYEAGVEVLEGSASVENATEEITKKAAIYLAE